MTLNELRNKSILILGFGREGQDTFLFLRKLFPKKCIGIADIKYQIQNTRYQIQNVNWHLGKNYLKAIKDYDIIIKSPGVPIHFPEIEKAFKEGKITSQTEIFFDNCPGQIAGVTGTKGKSTTTSLVYEILKKGGVKAHLVGNIGKPVLGLLKSATAKDIYVYELSAHQLYGLKKSPHIAVFLNVYPEHLDYYKDFQEYAGAKANITLYQNKNDYLVFNVRDKIIKNFAKKSKAKKVSIPTNYEFVKNTRIPLVGKFNLQNIMAAVEVGKLFEIPEEKIKKAIENFKPLPHRLELVGTFKGISFYDDALSTIPETAIAATEALGDRVQTIILGGFDRNIDFKNLAKNILENKNIKNVILFPTTGEKIWDAILKIKKGRRVLNPFFVNSIRNPRLSNGASIMKDAVRIAYENTQKGKICLLSTASTSFSIFRDYEEKGELFKKYVKELA